MAAVARDPRCAPRAGRRSADAQGARTSPWVRRLDLLTRDELAAAGGKAAGLAALIRAGLPVPPGFVVLTGAYRRFVDTHGLQPQIDRASAEAVSGDGDASAAAAALADRMRRMAVSGEVADALVAAYAELGRPTVAVRSSSAQEDLAGASFAGQYETVLGVGDDTALLAAVVRCWASAWGARVTAYRAAHGLAGDVDLAVIVQRQVDANRAGVLFTADPTTGRRDRIRIGGAWGLGPPVVDGTITPDEWVVDAGSLQIRSRTVADKLLRMVTTAQGVTTVPVPADQRAQPCLTDPEVTALARLGLQAQQACGQPQDLEWVADSDRLLLVQTRPMTTLFPLPEPGPAPGQGLRVYLSINRVSQGFVEPMTPMGNEMWRVMLAGVGRMLHGPHNADPYPSVYHLAAHRIYADATGMLQRPRLMPLFEEAFATKDAVAGRILTHLAEREESALRDQPRPRWPWRLFVRVLPAFVTRMLVALVQPEAAGRRIIRIADREVARQRAEVARLTGVEPRLAWLEEAAEAMERLVFRQAPYVVVAPMRLAERVERRLARTVGPADAFAAVHHSPHGNPGTEMGRDLLAAAQAIRDEGVVPAADHPAVVTFLERYGHRTVREVDVGQPRWREDPTTVLDWIVEAAADPDLDHRLARERDAVVIADRHAADILARVPGRTRRAVTGWGLWRTRRLAGLKERPKYDVTRFIQLWRDVLLAIGDELVADGRLGHAADVMYVTFADVRAGNDLRPAAAATRRAYEDERARTSIPRILTSTGETFFTAPAADLNADGLVGVPASPGMVEAPARIVAQPTAGAIEPGEVLVTRSTDPTWTPLILRAGAVVMETGGPLQHAAIVAREQGIPTVTGIDRATELLDDGVTIRVDGTAGTVTPL
jgi:rifampicin phosphotransferase